MAYVQEQNDPNAPQATAMGAPGPMNQPSTAGGGTAGPQGTTAVPNTTQAPPVQDLKAYLAANAPQAVQMGQNIAGNLNQTAGTVTGDINSAQQNVNQQVQSSVVPQNQNLLNEAAANPAQFVQNPKNLADFFAQENANYTGPTAFESTPQNQALTNEVQSAVQTAPDITQQGGVFQLARGQEQNPTTGMSNLDALLLQENPQAMAPIQAAIPGVQNLGNYLSGAQTATDKAIQDAIAADQATKAGVQTQFLTGPNAVVPTFQNELQTELQNAKGPATKAAQKAQADILNGTPTAADLALIKTMPGQFNELSGSMKDLFKDYGTNFDLTNYATMNSPDTVFANPNATATPEEYAKEAALTQLLEGGFNPVLNQSLAGNAGKQNNSLLNFNTTGAQGDIKNLLNANDKDLFNSALTNPKFLKDYGPATIEDILNNNNNAMYTARSVLSPEQQKAFDDALFRYGITPNQPPAPPGTPVGFNSPAPGIY